MPRSRIWLCGAIALAVAAGFSTRSMRGAAAPPSLADSAFTLHATRESPSDLELSGALAGFPPGSTRYLTRADLLALPQVTYTVTDDPSFKALGPTRISGVPLEELIQRFAAPDANMVVAICDDKYRANYPPDYRAAHHPLLVLTIDGKGPEDWPKGEGNMGPYLVSHPKFTPRFKVLSHEEEMQIPWGVVQIDFRAERQVYAPILPRGPHANDAEAQDGYRIARENCFRCHNSDGEGGQKAGVTWTVIAALAAHSPDFFAAYVRDPKSKSPQAKMPGNPQYDDATLRALAAYFRTFAPEAAQ